MKGLIQKKEKGNGRPLTTKTNSQTSKPIEESVITLQTASPQVINQNPTKPKKKLPLKLCSISFKRIPFCELLLIGVK